MGLYGVMCAIARTIQPATVSRCDVAESTVCWEWATTGYDLSHNDKEPETQLEMINGSNACDRGQSAIIGMIENVQCSEEANRDDAMISAGVVEGMFVLRLAVADVLSRKSLARTVCWEMRNQMETLPTYVVRVRKKPRVGIGTAKEGVGRADFS